MNRVPILSYVWSRNINTTRLSLRYPCPRAILLLSLPKSRKMTSSLQHQLRDPSTLSNYNEFVTTHTVASLTIDFEKKILAGNILLRLKPVTKTNGKEVILDSSYLDIQNVTVDGRSLKWDLLPRSEPLGSALKIGLDKRAQESGSFEIDVSSQEYFRWRTKMLTSLKQIKVQTTQACTALQWLTPAQTSNQKHSFLCQRALPSQNLSKANYVG